MMIICLPKNIQSRTYNAFFGHASKEGEMNILCIFCFKAFNDIKEKFNSKINLKMQAKKKKAN